MRRRTVEGAEGAEGWAGPTSTADGRIARQRGPDSEPGPMSLQVGSAGDLAPLAQYQRETAAARSQAVRAVAARRSVRRAVPPVAVGSLLLLGSGLSAARIARTIGATPPGTSTTARIAARVTTPGAASTDAERTALRAMSRVLSGDAHQVQALAVAARAAAAAARARADAPTAMAPATTSSGAASPATTGGGTSTPGAAPVTPAVAALPPLPAMPALPPVPNVNVSVPPPVSTTTGATHVP
jgi:hypothetical protein